MARKVRRKVKSKAQAGLFGLVAAGKPTQLELTGLSKKKAKEKLRGVKVGKLPRRVGRKR